MVQREGRILRKGNQYDEVEIYRYICEGSFDAYSWQILESKQKFISQFLIGSSYQREASDLEDNVLTYAEVKALALSDPRMKTLAESRIELANLRIINNKYIDTKNSLKADEETIRKGMPALDEQIRGTELNCRSIENRSKDDYKELRKTLICFLDPDLIKQEGEALGDAWGFAFDCPREQSQKEPFFIVSKNNVEYRIESGMSAAGNAQRVSNLFHGLEDYLKDLKTRKAEKENRLVRIHEELESANPYSERIRELENEINELQEQMDTDK